MGDKKRTPEIIKQALKKNWSHVFFVLNPITVIITKMIISWYKINSKNIKIFSFRDTDTSLLNYSVTKIYPGEYDRYLERFLFYSPTANIIKNEINSICSNFILYTSWAYLQAEKILQIDSCMGHIYIEEGQHSYMQIPEFNYKKLSLKDKFFRNWRNRFSKVDEIGFYFRNDSSSYIGIDKQVFPKINNKKKVILSNIFSIKKSYNPNLLGISTIGLTCASRRIGKEYWKDMFKHLIKEMNGEGVIKLHPSFSASKIIDDKIRNVFDEIDSHNVIICSNSINIELEMLFERKKIIGYKTSLSKYASIFGSDFKLLELDKINSTNDKNYS